MAKEWFVEKNGKKHGPMSGAKLKHLATSGKIQPEDLVWNSAMKDWEPASKIKGLFSNPTSKKVNSPPPLPHSFNSRSDGKESENSKDFGTINIVRKPKLTGFVYEIYLTIDGKDQGTIGGGLIDGVLDLILSRKKSVSIDLPEGDYSIELKGGGLSQKDTITVIAGTATNYITFFSNLGAMGGGLNFKKSDDDFKNTSKTISKAEDNPNSNTPPPIPDQDNGSVPALWNPTVLRAWSLLFTWGFGSFLMAKNWNVLGEIEKSKRSMKWFYGCLVFMFLAIITPDTPFITKMFRYVGIFGFIVWALKEATPHAHYVKDRFGDNYTRKSWIKPLSISLGILIICAIGIIASFESPNILLVKEGELRDYRGIKLGPVIENFLSDPEWEEVIDEQGVHYVNVSGGMTYMDKPVTGALQFRIRGEIFQFNAFELNGIPQNIFIKNSLIQKMYDEY